MTVTNTVNRYQYAGNASTTTFAFASPFIVPSDIAVLLWNEASNQAQPSTLNGGGSYDYTVVGTQDPTSGEYLSGANVVFNTAPPAGFTVTLWRSPPLTQLLALLQTGPLDINGLNTELDKSTMIEQLLGDQVARAVTAPWSDPPGGAAPSMALPAIAVRSGAVMGFGTDGSVATAGAGSLGVLESLLASGWTPSLTAIDWVGNVAGLRALTPPAAFALCIVAGYNNEGDKAPVVYGYSTSNSAADDGGLTIKPASVSGGSPGRWILQTGGRPYNVQDWGADPTNSSGSDTAFSAWFAALLANGQSGRIPAGHYKFGSQQAWNLAAVATSGVTVTGDGIARSVLDFSAVASSPNLKISGGSTALFYSAFRDFGVLGNIAGTVLQLGETGFTDALNSFGVRLQAKNSSTSASAVAVQSNQVLDSELYIVANCGGHGDALQLRQTQFCTIAGSHSNADIGEHFTGGFSFGNSFLAVDLEVVGICVQSDISTAAKNTWIGGQFVWTGAEAVLLNSASNYFRFIQPNLGVSGTFVAGSSASCAVLQEQFIGTNPSGPILIAPATGTDADMTLDAAAGQGGFIVYQRAGTPALQRWEAGMTNTAESGGNAGSNFQIARYNDAGSVIDNPLSIQRSTGIVTFQDGIATPSGSKLGVFGVTPATQPTNTGNSAQNNAGSTNATFQDTGFTGGTGTTPYTIGQIVAALKTLGFIAA